MKENFTLKYPPEIHMILAESLGNDLGGMKPPTGIILGQSLPDDLKLDFRSRKNTLDIGKVNETQGFSILDCGSGKCALVFECTNDDPVGAIESNAIALHAFKWLGIGNVVIMESVDLFDKSEIPFYSIDDHINLTSINPLDYWMIPETPDPFFLDARDLYDNEKLAGIPGIIHVATFGLVDSRLLDEAWKSGAGSYGRAFLPESLLAKYLGMRVSGIGVNGKRIERDISRFNEALINLLKRE